MMKSLTKTVIANWVAAQIEKESGCNVSQDRQAMARIGGTIEDAIRMALVTGNVSISLPYISQKGNGGEPVHFGALVLGSEIEKIIA